MNWAFGGFGLEDQHAISIFFRGKEVGTILPFPPDMWYMSGIWLVNEGEAVAGADFESMMKAESVAKNRDRGWGRLIRYGDDPKGFGVAMGIKDGVLHFRRVVGKEAVEYVKSHPRYQ